MPLFEAGKASNRVDGAVGEAYGHDGQDHGDWGSNTGGGGVSSSTPGGSVLDSNQEDSRDLFLADTVADYRGGR